MYTWFDTYIRSRVSNDRGQADLIVVALIIFLLYLLVYGRKVVVQ